MFARITRFEIDTVRISLDAALERFRALVLPELAAQPGFAGIYVLDEAGGQGMLISFWATAEDEAASRATGYYDEQLRKFVTFYREPPGRECYEVTFAQVPGAGVAIGGS